MIIDVFFFGELLLELPFVEITQLKLAHKFVHSVTIEELPVANLAYLTPNLVLWIFACLLLEL